MRFPIADFRLLIAAAMLVGVLAARAEQADTADLFLSECAKKADEAAQTAATTVPGRDGWLFFGPELHYVSSGRFWGEGAAAVSRATKPEYADPLPAILDFRDQLKAQGVELLLVPVPAKAIVYPDFLCGAVSVASNEVPPRLDASQQAFLKVLAEKGVEVLDLTGFFLANRFDPAGALYCRQDTHWSGNACVLAARKIAERIRPLAGDAPATPMTGEWATVEITGDLWRGLNDPSVPREKVRLRRVTTADGKEPVRTDESSPVLLLGDSHNLVFHAGDDMYAEGAGLADQLALELGFPVDLVGVRGSGATPARINLLRRAQRIPGYWKGKRVVVWCFAARELTESDGWRKVPIQAP